MADQQKWFKFWCSAPADDDLQALPPAIRWAWAAFGAYTKEHGTKGRVVVRATNAALAAQMGIAQPALFDTIKLLPHMDIEEGENRNGEIIVTWRNWQKYQSDSTVAERQKRWREKNRNGARGEEKRAEETRAEKNNSPQGGQFQQAVEQIWNSWPKHKRKNKGDVEKSIKRINPSPALLQTILTKLEALKASASWKKDDGQFIPYPASWLNAKGWEDEVDDFLGTTPRRRLAD